MAVPGRRSFRLPPGRDREGRPAREGGREDAARIVRQSALDHQEVLMAIWARGEALEPNGAYSGSRRR